MGNMIIDLQLASENTEGLPSEAQILQWATAAVQPESDNVEMTVPVSYTHLTLPTPPSV